MRSAHIRRPAVFAALALSIEARACFVEMETVILKDPLAAFETAESVLYATVQSWNVTEDWWALATLDVHQVWKGEGSPEVFNYLGSTCSRQLQVGETYLI